MVLYSCLAQHARTLTHLVAKPLLARAECAKVLGRLGDHVGAQLKFDATDVLAAHLHVKVDCDKNESEDEVKK